MLIQIWTDGSINIKRDNKCSYAFLCKIDGEMIREYYDEIYGEQRTGNVAELTAIIKSLEWLYVLLDNMDDEFVSQCEVFVYSDSQYCVKGITEWIHSWRLSNFQGKKNIHLWRDLYQLAYKSVIKPNFVWIKGHSGIEENERVDQLAKLVTVKKK